MVKCCSNTCDKGIYSNSKAVRCSGSCEGLFHIKCAGVSEALFENIRNTKLLWRCNKCPSANESFVVVEDGTTSNNVVIEDDEISNSDQSVSNNDRSEFNIDELLSFDLSNCDINKMALFLKTLATVVIDIRRSQNYTDDIIKQSLLMVEENKTLIKRLTAAEEKINHLELKINKLEYAIDQPRQSKNINNIVLAGLPADIPNPTDAVLTIGKKIGANIQKEDISKITQISSNTTNRSDNNSKNTLYVLELTNINVKNELMEKKNYTKTFLLLMLSWIRMEAEKYSYGIISLSFRRDYTAKLRKSKSNTTCSIFG